MQDMDLDLDRLLGKYARAVASLEDFPAVTAQQRSHLAGIYAGLYLAAAIASGAEGEFMLDDLLRIGGDVLLMRLGVEG